MRSLSIRVVLAALVLTPPALADSRAECLSAYESAQRARKAGDLLSAKSELERCSRQECPGLVRSDCVVWLGEVNGALPSVVVRVRDAQGADVTDAKVFVDDRLVQEKSDGRPIVVNPGEHRLRIERGAERVERRVVAAQGERDRTIAIELPSAAPAPAAVPPPAPREPEQVGSPPVAAWILAGVSAVALGSFAYFGLTGRSEIDDLRSSCAPSCRQSDLDAARTKLIIADVSLAIAVVSGGAAIWVFVDHGSSSERGMHAGAAFRF